MIDLDSYLRRIGYSGPREPTLVTLRALHALHPRAIPFENLDTLSGVPVRIDLDSLQRKLVHGRRGGYCFEHNTLFRQVLEALGFEVIALAARVVWDRPAGARTHMLLLVQLGPDDRYLADVGFGGLTLTAPLRFPALDASQATPHEDFRVGAGNGYFEIAASVREEWKPLYRFTLEPQLPVDIELLNHYVVSHVDSPMKGRLVAARVESDRRFGLGNGVLREHRVDGTTDERRIGSVAELRDVLRATFGIEAPTGAASDAALARVLE
jgi:N-hydroxyarylamine O-acetyltransferase